MCHSPPVALKVSPSGILNPLRKLASRSSTSVEVFAWPDRGICGERGRSLTLNIHGTPNGWVVVASHVNPNSSVPARQIESKLVWFKYVVSLIGATLQAVIQYQHQHPIGTAQDRTPQVDLRFMPAHDPSHGYRALQWSKELSVWNNTAWYLLHRLRVVCGVNMVVLKGEVEIDETYLGGKEANKHESKKLKQGREAVGKQTVLGTRERGGDVKAMVIDSTSQNEIHPHVHANVEQGSTLYTVEHKGYDVLDAIFFSYERITLSVKEFVREIAHTDGIESVWAVLKRGYVGTYHNWSVKHCRAYVNELSFRLDQNKFKRDSQDRLNSLIRSMAGKTITYKELLAC